MKSPARSGHAPAPEIARPLPRPMSGLRCMKPRSYSYWFPRARAEKQTPNTSRLLDWVLKPPSSPHRETYTTAHLTLSMPHFSPIPISQALVTCGKGDFGGDGTVRGVGQGCKPRKPGHRELMAGCRDEIGCLAWSSLSLSAQAKHQIPPGEVMRGGYMGESAIEAS